MRECQNNKFNYQQQVALHLVSAVVVLDDKLTIQYVNPAAEALLLRSYKKLIGFAFHDVFFNDSINDQRLMDILTTGQEFTDNEVLLSLTESTPITVEITVSSIELNNNAHILLELKQVDQLKQISAETFQLHQWEAARDLIKGLAHEIKNPLGGLRGAAQLLAKEISTEQQEYTNMIIDQADRLTNLVDRLLGPNQLPQLSTENIHQVLEKIYQLTQFNNPKNITIVRDYDPSLPEIEFDQEKIQQAILNIVSNAAQAIAEYGEIRFKTRIATNQTINGELVKLSLKICIIDNGPGIPLKIQDTLFYPMVSGRDNGTGLGLSISQTLINQHQGKLSCKSQPGCTEFIILLPI
jgi:two-component system, NtrC family, nitrogen regulation sensor histidine kinase GlnL